ncbi:MCE family protein [Mycolicibacterium thermoresistibile]|nr:MCE family protein [Mycolicibacterium thermoresistibile]MCV7189904.1 MCE family protein [Mycolicibacterium thermoresistibile]SNW19216.1 virulence factor Mce family protein [Mycolicibacterium thermoresistibile]
MKPFAERNKRVMGAVGIGVGTIIIAGALQYDNLPVVSSDTRYSAYFAESGGLRAGAAVQVSGMRVGKVSAVELDGPHVRVEFRVRPNIRLGELSEAAIKTKSLLGAKILDITSRGEGRLSASIPVERTVSPYELPDALGDLASTIAGLDTAGVSESLATLAETFENTPAEVQAAVRGVTRFSESLGRRDQQLRQLLENARKATGVLGERSQQIAALVRDSNALLVQLRTESAALDQLSANISALAQQVSGFISENHDTLSPALEKLNGVLTIVENRKEQVQDALHLAQGYHTRLGEAVSSGPFFNSYVANLLPGQFVQPFIDAAFSDLGLDPNVLLPSQLNDPQVGQPGTPAAPVPYPRTGQGGGPRLTLPDAITGNPGDPRYPYREPLPAPPPGGPPPGPPAAIPPVPVREPVFVPAPNEVSAGEPDTPEIDGESQ